MKRCGICRKNYRGAGRRVVTADGNKNACPACVARAFLVVPVDSFAPCVSCGKAASLCGVCARGRNISDRATAMEDAAQPDEHETFLKAWGRHAPQLNRDVVLEAAKRALDAANARGVPVSPPAERHLAPRKGYEAASAAGEQNK